MDDTWAIAFLIDLLLWIGLLTFFGIRLIKRKKFHWYYLLCVGLFLLTALISVFSGFLFGSSYWRRHEDDLSAQFMTFLSIGTLLLGLAIPVLSIVSFFQRNKPWYMIALSVFMLLISVLFISSILLFAGMGKIGG